MPKVARSYLRLKSSKHERRNGPRAECGAKKEYKFVVRDVLVLFKRFRL